MSKKKDLLSPLAILLGITLGSLLLPKAYAYPPSGNRGGNATPLRNAVREIYVHNALHVELVQSSSNMVRVHASPKIASEVEITESNGKLTLRKTPSVLRFWGNRKKIKITVFTTNPGALTKVKLTGASTLKFFSPVHVDELDVDASGSSQATIKANVRSLEIDLSGASFAKVIGTFATVESELSGASKLVLNGSAQKAEYDLSGASHVEAMGCFAGEVDVEASGASTANVSARSSIAYTLSGASKLIYKGNARILRESLSGGSSCRRH